MKSVYKILKLSNRNEVRSDGRMDYGQTAQRTDTRTAKVKT